MLLALLANAIIKPPIQVGPAAWNLQGRIVYPTRQPRPKATIFIFLLKECPIANQYAPEIERIYRDAKAKSAQLWLVYCDPESTAQSVATHRKSFAYSAPALIDREKQLQTWARATHTPHAILIDRQGSMRYRGRIDDRFGDLGRKKSQPTRRDLRLALSAVLQGKPVVVTQTRVVGCLLPPP
jgi:hypothetical protein